MEERAKLEKTVGRRWFGGGGFVNEGEWEKGEEEREEEMRERVRARDSR